MWWLIFYRCTILLATMKPSTQAKQMPDILVYTTHSEDRKIWNSGTAIIAAIFMKPQMERNLKVSSNPTNNYCSSERACVDHNEWYVWKSRKKYVKAQIKFIAREHEKSKTKKKILFGQRNVCVNAMGTWSDLSHD